MGLERFIKLAKAYRALGDSIQGQLDSVLAGNAHEYNPNALIAIKRFLKVAGTFEIDSDDIDDALTEIAQVGSHRL